MKFILLEKLPKLPKEFEDVGMGGIEYVDLMITIEAESSLPALAQSMTKKALSRFFVVNDKQPDVIYPLSAWL